MPSIDPLQKNAVTVTGNQNAAITLMFINGFCTDQRVWTVIAKAFSDEFRLVFLDNVGTGRALRECFIQSHYLDLNAYADDVLAICDAVDAQQVILVGHSVGSMIAVLAANKKPSIISRLILIGASPRYLNDADYFGGFTRQDLEEVYSAISVDFDNWLDDFTKQAMGNLHKPSLARDFAESIRTIPRDQILTALYAIFQNDHRAAVKKLIQPTLLIQTRDDIFVPLAVAEYLHNVIGDSHLTIINTSGHLPHISAPLDVIAAIKSHWPGLSGCK